jgi:rifampicin phosphotransferase
MNTRIHTTIKPLNQITPDDESRSGAKAYNCARLKQAGFRVPDGIVILSTATASDLEALAHHPWVDALPPDTVFAVRSSGIGEDSGGQSFAGIHQTLLDVPRADLRSAVLTCQASARSGQALEYRRAQGLSTAAIEMGVLIQQMIHPAAAGVAFTVNPVTGADDELVINSSWGVGEALVSGQVDPDEFVIRKNDLQLLWTRLGEKSNPELSKVSSLSSDQIQELSKMLVEIEHHYGTPQDVEWCHDGTDFWVVQSRPITTAALRGSANEIEWTRANLVEVLPDVTSPQALYGFEDLLNQGERQYMGNLLAPEQELGPLLKSFYGRLYFNLSQMRRVCGLAGTAPAEMLRSMGHGEAIQPADEKPARVSVRERLSGAPDFIRIVLRHLRAATIVREHEVQTQRQLSRLAAADPRSLPDDQIWLAIEEWFREGPDSMKAVLLLGGVLFQEAPVRSVCAKIGFPYESLVYPQLATGEKSVSAQQAFDLVALADIARLEPASMQFLCGDASNLPQFRVMLRGTAFLAEFERFLEKYGHRGHYESDWSLPRYSEDPTPLLRAIRAHIEEGSDRTVSQTAEKQQIESANAWAAFAQHLSPWQKCVTLPRVRRSIQKIKQYYVWRERVRSDMVRVLAAARKWHLVLAERFVERGWLDGRNPRSEPT